MGRLTKSSSKQRLKMTIRATIDGKTSESTLRAHLFLGMDKKHNIVIDDRLVMVLTLHLRWEKQSEICVDCSCSPFSPLTVDLSTDVVAAKDQSAGVADSQSLNNQ